MGAGAPEAFPHTDATQVRDGEVSWNLKQGYTAFTAAGWQRVSGLTAGETVTARGYGWVYTCNTTETSCIIEGYPYRRSDPAASASLSPGVIVDVGSYTESAFPDFSLLGAPGLSLPLANIGTVLGLPPPAAVAEHGYIQITERGTYTFALTSAGGGGVTASSTIGPDSMGSSTRKVVPRPG